MEAKVQLPLTNNYGYYEIRLESIGGLGANLTGKILGEMGALYLGLNCSSFASYGSEKKGSPVKSFIRYSSPEQEIRINSPVEHPHLLGIFHETIDEKQGVMAGVSEETAVVINSTKEPQQVRHSLKMHAGTLYCLDALKIAIDCKTRVNMVMLGALVKASGFIPLQELIETIKNTIGLKYPAALAGNLEGIRQGYEQAVGEAFAPLSDYPFIQYSELQRSWGYENAPIGGVNPIFGSTVDNDLSSSREGYIPVFKRESCIHCGLCDTTCPDMVFQFAEGEYKGKPSMINLGPDYHHCKGCLRCTEVCPTDALTAGMEWEHDLSKTHVRNQDLIIDRMSFESAGSNSWMESESYTTNEIV